MKRLALLAIPLALAGCASPAHHKSAVMHHPETGDTQRCEVDPLNTWQWNFKSELANCVEGYEEVGYQRVDHPS